MKRKRRKKKKICDRVHKKAGAECFRFLVHGIGLLFYLDEEELPEIVIYALSGGYGGYHQQVFVTAAEIYRVTCTADELSYQHTLRSSVALTERVEKIEVAVEISGVFGKFVV